MESENSQDLMNLSNDWWRQRSTCEHMARWFEEYLLGLYLAYEDKDTGQTHHELYTGFLLYHRDAVLWVTAGHVVNRINQKLSTPESYQVIRMRWLDRCETPHAESIPVNQGDLITFSAYEDGIDLGMINLHGIILEDMLSGGGRVRLLTEQIWVNLDHAQPEGYYILGYPNSLKDKWLQVQEGHFSDGRIWGLIRAHLAILPVKRLEHSSEEVTKVQGWNDPEAFYGQIMPFANADKLDFQPQSIDGMSGGPVFSVERTSCQRPHNLIPDWPE